MPQELEFFGASGDAPFSSVELILNLAIGLVLAVILRWHFLRFGSTLSNRDELGGVLPFILLQLLGLALIFIWEPLVTWLPAQAY
jgi:TRAP-type mannitol/chloroaromatic compound transport system permease large subunit